MLGARPGPVEVFRIEGTGAHGAGLSRFLLERGHCVVEVNRPDPAIRHRLGKRDPIDAEIAARAVLPGVATGTPKAGDGRVEMIRMLKIARDSAVKARTQSNPSRLTSIRASNPFGLTVISGLGAACRHFLVRDRFRLRIDLRTFVRHPYRARRAPTLLQARDRQSAEVGFADTTLGLHQPTPVRERPRPPDNVELDKQLLRELNRWNHKASVREFDAPKIPVHLHTIWDVIGGQRVCDICTDSGTC